MLRKALMALMLLFAAQTARAEDITIAALGDSLTQGYGLRQQDGFVPRMERWLKRRGVEVKIINAGVSGDTTAGGAARVNWTLTPEVDGLIVALGGNDVLRGIDPATIRANLATILDAARKAGVPVLLVGLQAPPNFGGEYAAAVNKLYPELAAEYGVLFTPNFFKGMIEGVSNPASVLALFQKDGIHPNAKGVRKIVKGLGPDVRALVSQIEDGS